jgi:hypothetical protein
MQQWQFWRRDKKDKSNMHDAKHRAFHPGIHRTSGKWRLICGQWTLLTGTQSAGNSFGSPI